MIVYPADYNKSRPLSPDFAIFLSHLWRSGQYGIFWTASCARLSADEASHLTQAQNRKKPARAGDSKVRLTTWVDLSLPLPDFLPPQDFRNPFYGLIRYDLERRLVKPDESGLSNLYFGVNPFFSPDARLLPVDKFGRRSVKFRGGTANESVAAVNCIFAEIDVKDFDGNWQAVDAYIKRLPISPSVIIKSGGGYHLYWLLRDTFLLYGEGFVRDLSRFSLIRGVQHAWVGSFEGLDQAAKGIPWLLRPAGSINVKEKYAPNYLSVDFVMREMGLVYELPHFQEVIASLAKLTIVIPTPAKSTSKPQASKSASRNPQLRSNQSSSWQPPTFEYLPSFGSQRAKIDWHLQYFNHDNYDDWRLIALLLSGESDGYEIWSDWSRQSHKFDEVNQKATWEEIQQARKERIKKGKAVGGIGGLIKRARDKGAPTAREVPEYQPVRKPNNRVYLGELRCGVGSELASLIKPNSWALLNPEEADNVFSLPKRQGKRSKPLQSVVLDHIGGGTRRLRIGGKRSKVKTCLVIAQTAMTRFLALHAQDANQAASIQSDLAAIGITSLSYPVNVQFEPTSEKGEQNGHFPISYIYKADGFSKNDDLGKMGKPVSCSPFFEAVSVRREHSYVVLVFFSKDVPASLLPPPPKNPQIDPIGLLALPSVSPPYFAKKTLKISLCGPTGQREFILESGNVGFRTWHDILSADIFNEPMALTGLPVGGIEIKRVRAQSNRITDSFQSVARWHNRRHVRLTSQICACGQALMRFDTGDGYEAGWCAACGGLPITSFIQEASALEVTLDELAVQITSDNQLGQTGDYVYEYQPETVPAVDMAAESAHRDLVARIRKELEEDLKQGIADGSFKGKIIVIDMTAGGGKSTIVRKMIRRWWHEHKLLSRITTDTKRLAVEWNEELGGSLLIRSFVFQSLADCCECFPYEVKVQAIARGYGLSHDKGCLYVAQINDLLRGGDKKQKGVAILRHEHLRIRLQNRRLVAGADIYISDENFLGGLLERDSISLQELEGTLRRMQKANCTPAEMAIPAALFEVLRTQIVAPYQHVNGLVIVELVEDWLKQRRLTVGFCLEAIKKTKFAQKQKLLAGDFSTETVRDLPKQWLRRFLEAFEQTIKNPVHPSFFLEQASKNKQFSQLRLAWGIKHQYLPEYNRPLDEAISYHFLLDATPNRLILEALLPDWEIEFRSYKIPPSPRHRFIQIDGINLTRKNLRENFKPTFSKLLAILNDLDLLVEAVVTRKDIFEAVVGNLGLDDSMVLTFRNQRGSNRLKDASIILVFGDATIPTNAALRLAHILWSHDTKPFETYSNGSHFTKSGGLWIAKDKRVQAVLDQVKEEGIQGTQRGRLINGDKPKTIISVSNFELAELIDGLDKSRVERIDAKRLHGNSRKVRYALDTYGDRARR